MVVSESVSREGGGIGKPLDSADVSTHSGKAMFLKMVGISIVMILALSAGIGGSISFFVMLSNGRSPSPLILIGGVGGFVLAGWLFWLLLKMNRQWVDRYSEKFDTEPDGVVAQWEVDEVTWNVFADRELEQSKNDTPFASLLLGGVVAAITLFVAWKPAGVPLVFVWAVGLGLFVAMVSWFVMSRSSKRTASLRKGERSATVWLRPDGVRINKRIITWAHFGSRLESIAVEPSAEDQPYAVLQVGVSTSTGNGRAHNDHRIAVPRDREEEVRRVVETAFGMDFSPG
ncbi:MAG: hypothetical protein CMO55_11930 [Verrucomicrobiales bacterium]|nr:hypothetical protein [Verrucomicrobiales bacterium]